MKNNQRNIGERYDKESRKMFNRGYRVEVEIILRKKFVIFIFCVKLIYKE